MRTTTAGDLVFSVADPTLSIAVWDFQTRQSDVTGKSVPQGEHLGFQISTNMYAALDGPSTASTRITDSIDCNRNLPLSTHLS